MRDRSVRRCLCAFAFSLPLTLGSCEEARPAAAVSHPPPAAAVAGASHARDETEVVARLEAAVRPMKGVLGIAVRVLGGGRQYALRGDEPFPMASVYKVPIAMAVLAKVQAGELALDHAVTLQRADLRGGRSDITKSFTGTHVTMTLGALIETMVVTSDNTASDAVLRAAGGATAVTTYLRRLGVSGVRVDRTEEELTAVFDDADRMARFADDPRDTATPNGMVGLLETLFEGRALDATRTRLLLSMMERATPDRMRLGLPPVPTLAHKTGTILGSVNDVGIVTLPDGRHVAIAVFVKRATFGEAQMDRAVKMVADAARAAYDYATAAPTR